MNKLLVSVVLAIISLTASSQKVYFIYLQTESEQPFFIKMNEKVYSSSASGYLILSKLHDSTYSFKVGFPQNKWPEQAFTVSVNKKDHGYLLKNFDEKGWGLFDLQTLTVQMTAAGTAKAEDPAKTETKNGGSTFTDILSKASDDPSLKEKPVQPKAEEVKAPPVVQTEVKKEESVTPKPAAPPVVLTEVKKEESVIPKPAEPPPAVKVTKEEPATTKPVESVEPVKAIKEDTITAKPAESIEQVKTIKEEVKAEIKELPSVKTEEVKEEVKPETISGYKMSVVSKRAESSTTEGFGLIYIDKYEDGTTDTVRLLIPNPKVLVPVVKEEPKEEKKMLDIPVEISSKPVDTKPPVVIDTPATKPVIIETPVTKPVVVETPATKPEEKTRCADVAVEADFFTLRKTMAAAVSDDDMITEARKYFKQKCFTTAQVKNLGALFLTDEGKYRFYDAAYTYASDKENFPSLQAELKDEYYITRFKAMLRN